MADSTQDSNQKRRRLLISAFAIAPNRGSEPGVGWHRAIQAAHNFDVWVLCASDDYETSIQPWLKSNGPIDGLSFYPVYLSGLENRLHLKPLFTYLIYNRWQRKAFAVALELHKKYHFDIVHHVTWNSFREPGYLWRLDAPFIWGPVGGTQNYPWQFLARAGLPGALSEGIRTIVNQFQLRHGGRVRKVARRSAMVLAANSTGARDFKEILGVQVECLPEAGVGEISHSTRAPFSSDRPLRVLWSGLFNHCKALHLLLEALGSVRGSFKFELRVVGDGRLRRRWKRAARRFGIEDRCEWVGFVPHTEAVKHNGWADVLVFTSMRDTSGNVVLEALTRGVPVICFDHFGAGDTVTNECGIKIPVSSPSKSIRTLGEALQFLAQNPDELESLRKGAVKRAREYSWEQNGRRMIAHYHDVLSGNRTNGEK